MHRQPHPLVVPALRSAISSSSALKTTFDASSCPHLRSHAHLTPSRQICFWNGRHPSTVLDGCGQRVASRGHLPASSKTAIITPRRCWRSHRRTPASSTTYRPVSNLSFLSKVIERIVARHAVRRVPTNGRTTCCHIFSPRRRRYAPTDGIGCHFALSFKTWAPPRSTVSTTIFSSIDFHSPLAFAVWHWRGSSRSFMDGLSESLTLEFCRPRRCWPEPYILIYGSGADLWHTIYKPWLSIGSVAVCKTIKLLCFRFFKLDTWKTSSDV